MHLLTMQESPLWQLFLRYLTLQQLIHFSRGSRSQHRNEPVELYVPRYQWHEICEEHVDGIVEVVEGSHQHEHGPQAEDCEKRAVVPLLEFEYTADVSMLGFIQRDAESLTKSHLMSQLCS